MADSQVGPAPTYNELYNMVEQLREQLESRSQEDGSRNAREEIELNVTLVSRSEVAEFRVIPNLNKTIAVSNGRETSHQADDWLGDLNGIAAMNGWPISYRLQFVRFNVQGSARDWFVGRSLVDWADFEA